MARALERLWDLDTVGITGQRTESSLSADEESAVRQFESGLSCGDGRYTVVSPKRESISLLPNNRLVAEQRLERKISQLRQDPQKYRRYDQEILRFVQDGYAAEVDVSAAAGSSDIDGSCFMPHHEVITRSDSTEKWRIVFDCSAKAKGATSLNQHLLPGPNLNPDLVKLLLNFRLHTVAVSADITEAYMRIGVSPNDQPYFRFLWRSPDSSLTKVFQMGRVTWGATSSGFLLAATVRHHLRKADHASQELAGCLYADDFLQSFESDEQAIEFTNRIRAALDGAGMSLAKWKTNSAKFTAHLRNTGVEPKLFDVSDSGLFGVLGISWCPDGDVFRFEMPQRLGIIINLVKIPTKREVLSVMASIYDPMSWLTPFTLRGKFIIQRLWTTDLEWGQLIPSEVHDDFKRWVLEIATLTQIRIPRQYITHGPAPIARRLYVFGDTSARAYVRERSFLIRLGHEQVAACSTRLTNFASSRAARGALGRTA